MIYELSTTAPRVTSILDISGTDGGEAAAMAAGADGFLSKPLTNLNVFQHSDLATLPEHRQLSGPRALCGQEVCPDPLAYRDDMVHASNLLGEHTEGPVLDYVAQFLSGVARSADDTQLERAASALQAQRRSGAALTIQLAQLADLVQERLASRMAI